MRLRLLPVLLVAVAVVAGCASQTGNPPASSGSTPAPTSTGGSTGGPAPTTEPPDTGGDYRVSYDWAVPSGTVEIKNNSPSGQPTLVAIYVGNHPEGSPAYQRISYYFHGGFPSYRFGYVPSVVSDAKGDVVPLPGNAFLRIVFVGANAHTDSGASSITAAPPATIGFQNLKGYAPAGDFEGYVTYGLGLQVAPNSDQVLKIRVGELHKPDGSYVVHFDVQTA
jgi:hypothetical protein